VSTSIPGLNRCREDDQPGDPESRGPEYVAERSINPVRC
jgi:hypothetical protein